MNQHPASMKQLTLELKQIGNLQRVPSFGSILNNKANKQLFKIVGSSLLGSNVSTEKWKA